MDLQLKRRLFLAAILLAISCPPVFSQQAPASPSSPTPASPASITPAQLIQFLNQTIAWYHQVILQSQLATAPEEQMTAYDNRQIADQVVRLAFDFARQQARTIGDKTASKSSAGAGGSLPQYEALQQMQSKLDQDYQSTQAELNDDRKKLATAGGAARRKLESTIPELQGELALIQARRDAVSSIVQFVGSSARNGGGAADLRAQIEALAASVPNATSNLPESSEQTRRPSPAPTAASNAPQTSGIWDLASDLFTLSSKKSAIDSLIERTNALSAASQQLRAPFVSQLRELSAKGDQLSAQADTANQSMLVQERQQLDSLAAQFKQISAAVIPLSKQSVLLNLYQQNLANQRDGIQARYKSDLKDLGLRLGFLGVILAILIGLGELWRRAVFRYVHEPRRRHQFLLLRKFALGFMVVIIIAMTLAGRLSSVATFAGLLTAGVALALQNVIVAIVGYFFLIGKFGIRIGDRVQAAGTTGEVIDVGLVRFHLIELGKGGTPTGRVVAFSNSIVFQPGAGLFKEIPGTSFAWHEVTTTVPRQADFTLVREKLLEAVEKVLRDYHDDIVRQYQQMEKTGILLPENGLRPRFDLHVTSAAVEVTIRYPVDLLHSAEIDARVSQELIRTIERESQLKAAEAPEVHVKTDVSPSEPR